MKRTTFLILLLAIGLSFTQTLAIGACKRSVEGEETTMLKLQGQVVEFRLLDEDRHKIRFAVRLKLTFANDGAEPIILLKQRFEVGAEMLARSCEEASSGKFLYTSTHWSSVSQSPEWASWRQHLDTKSPALDLMAVLRQGQSISVDVETALNIEKAGSFDKTNKSWAEIRRSSTVCLLVEVQTWPTNLEPNHNPQSQEFGEALRRRWRSFGALQLERLRSEPIPLTFPASANTTP
jgi:hypothetical protein